MMIPKIHRATVRSVVAVTSVVALGALAACTSNEPESESASIVIAMPEEPVSLDPCDASYTQTSRILTENVTQALMRRDPTTGELVPQLAESWEQVDAKTYDFTLRIGVTFSDGTPLDPEVVAVAINRTFNPDFNCGVKGFIFNNEDLTAEAAGDNTVRVTSTIADPILPLRVSFIEIGLASEDEKTDAPIGTGPFVIDNWQRRTSISLSRNPDYWGDAPEIENVKYVFRAESSVRANMVRTGEADMAIQLAAQDLGDGTGVETFDLAETLFLRFDMTAEPLNDVDIRRAVNYAIDREGLTSTVMQGLATPATQIILKNINGYDPSIEVWPYDPDEARDLIAAAESRGVDVGREITLYSRAGFYANSGQVMEGVAEMLRTVGLNVVIRQLDAAAWLDDVLRQPLAEDRVGITENVHGNNTGDAVFTVVTKFATGGDESSVSDSELDALIAEATAATGDERGELFRQAMNRITTQIVATVPIAHLSGALMMSDRLSYTPNLQSADILRVSEMTIN